DWSSDVCSSDLGDVHDVPRVDVARNDQVAHQPVAVGLEGAEADRRGLDELAGEHCARPRGRIGATLDSLHGPEVAKLQVADVDHEGDHQSSDLSASGI